MWGWLVSKAHAQGVAIVTNDPTPLNPDCAQPVSISMAEQEWAIWTYGWGFLLALLGLVIIVRRRDALSVAVAVIALAAGCWRMGSVIGWLPKKLSSVLEFTFTNYYGAGWGLWSYSLGTRLMVFAMLIGLVAAVIGTMVLWARDRKIRATSAT